MLETFIIKEKISITLDASSGANVVPLFTYIPYTKSGYRLIDEYLEIENLKVTSWIYSLPPVPFPVFELTDAESKQLLAAINLEWQSDRIQFNLVFKIDNTSAWNKVSAYSLLNRSPYPYGEYSLGNHSLGNNSMLGLQLQDVGFGLLQPQLGTLPADNIVAHAEFKRVVLLERLVDDGVKIANNITTIASTIINRNINRKGLTIVNSSDKNVFIDIVSTVSTSSYQKELEPGDYWESPAPIYTGVYYAVVANGSTAIDIREFM